MIIHNTACTKMLDVKCDYNITRTQRREALPLATLKLEACPQISAHDLIVMCGLESQALGYNNLQKINDSDPFRKKGGVRGAKKSHLKARVVDIRSSEEFRLGHVLTSKNIPESAAFQADGSLNPSLSLGAVPKGRVIVVVGGKKEKEPVVSTCDQCS